MRLTSVVVKAAPRTPAKIRDAVIDRLLEDAPLIADRFATELHATHPLYRAISDQSFLDRTHEAAETGMRSFSHWLRSGGGGIDDATREYYEIAGRDAADLLVPLEALHEPVQLALQHLFTWVVDECGPTAAGRGVALSLIEELLAFEAAVLAVLTGSYMAERFQADAEERHVRREIIENLVSGRRIGPQFATRLIAGYGVDVDEQCTVVVAGLVDGGDQAQLEAAVDILQRQPVGTQRLMVARDGELVAIMPSTSALADLVDACRTARDHLRRVHGVDLIVGLSSPGRLDEVPDRYQEARAALKFAAASDDGVVAMPDVRIFDYLVTRFDSTARRMVPSELLALLREDARLEGALTATLRALADNDLNVGRSARALFVHPNTVHYRLKRIADITGRDPKRLFDLVDLLVVAQAVPESG